MNVRIRAIIGKNIFIRGERWNFPLLFVAEQRF